MNNALLKNLKKVSLFFALTLIIAFVFVNVNNVFIKDFRQQELELLPNSFSNETPDPMPTMFPTIDDSKQKNIEQNVKCLGFDRKYSYVTQDVCDMIKKYWTSKFGYFPTDPEEVVECKGADGKISFVKRLVCEETNKFWDTHKPSEVSNNSTNSNNTLGVTASPTPIPTAPPWYLAGGAPTPVAAYQADGAGSIEESRVNLVNPGVYDLEVALDATSPTWDSITGWNMSAGQVWNTGVIPDQNFSAIIRFSDQSNTLFALFGSDGRNTIPKVDFSIGVINIPGVIEYTNFLMGDTSGSQLMYPQVVLSGVLGMTPLQGWRDGISVGTRTSSWEGVSIYPIYLGATSHHGVVNNPSVGKIQRFALWNVDISDYMPAISDAIND